MDREGIPAPNEINELGRGSMKMNPEEMIEQLNDDSPVEEFLEISSRIGEQLSQGKKDVGPLIKKLNNSLSVLGLFSSRGVFIRALISVLQGYSAMKGDEGK